MKILWVTSTLVGAAAAQFGAATGGAGGWIEQNLELLRDHQVVIVCSGRNPETICKKVDNLTYYVIPGGDVCTRFRASNKEAILAAREILKNETPDIIHIWGTETELGLLFARESGNTPKVVYIQGVMSAIHAHYYDSVSKTEVLRNTTIRDIYKKRTYFHLEKDLDRKDRVEKEILNRCRNFISDNNWCEAACKAIAPDSRFFRQNLPIDSVFASTQWTGSRQHTLFCASQYATFKGFPVLLRALRLVKKEFPDVMLEIPGGWSSEGCNMPKYIDGYSKMINQLIETLGLKENIRNLGTIKRNEMAQHLAETSVFVQASSVENHSSTLREALTVGVPSVASDVGCAAEYIIHGENGFLVRDDEPETMAYYICSLFRDPQLCEQISQKARSTVQKKYQKNESYSLEEIYSMILRGNQDVEV